MVTQEDGSGAAGPESGPVRPDRARIVEVVFGAIIESLAVPRAKLSLSTRLFTDLKADSLDFLEMLFAVERAFDIKLREKTLQLLLRTDFDEARLTSEGFLSPDEVAKLEPWLPALRGHEAKDKLTPRQVFAFVTVELLVMLIEAELPP